MSPLAETDLNHTHRSATAACNQWSWPIPTFLQDQTRDRRRSPDAGNPASGHVGFHAAGPTNGRPQADQRFRLASRLRGSEAHTPLTLDLEGIDFTACPNSRAEGLGVAQLLGVQPCLQAPSNKGAAHELSVAANAAPGCPHSLSQRPRVQVHPCTEGRPGSVPEGMVERRRENPLHSALLPFAAHSLHGDSTRVPAEPGSGLAMAVDVHQLDLSGTKLVLLSGCESFRPGARTSRAVIGLERSFLATGAETLVTSLWHVQDRPRQELLLEFYRRIVAGEPHVDALAEPRSL